MKKGFFRASFAVPKFMLAAACLLFMGAVGQRSWAQAQTGDRLGIGIQSSPGNGSSDSASGLSYRYQYLAGGAGRSQNWTNWNEDGNFVRYYIDDSVQHEVTPVFVYFMLCQATDQCNSDPNGATISHLQDSRIMRSYWEEVALFFQKAAAYPDREIILHVEPDMWGHLQLAMGSDQASNYPYAVRVGSTGVPGLEGVPDNLSGLAQAYFVLRQQHNAGHVKIAYHLSDWGTGVDIGRNNPSPSDVEGLGASSARFYQSLGQPFDLTFNDLRDRDAGYYANFGDNSAWWDEQDYQNHIRYLQTFHQATGQPLALWQIPFGNTLYRSMDNSWGHFQDNAVQTLLGESDYRTLSAYQESGVVALLFGQGGSGTTCPCDAMNDGVTNPEPINGNDLLTDSADDDGGYFKAVLAAYLQNGTVVIRPTQTATTLPSPTSTDSPLPTETLAPVATGCSGLTQEGEDGVIYGSRFVIQSGINSEGGRYIGVPNGSGSNYNGAQNNGDYVEYCFNVSTAGRYKLVGSVAYAGDRPTSDSFWVQINDTPLNGYKWFLTEIADDRFISDEVNDYGLDDPVEVFLSEGEQKVKLFLREDGALLDNLSLVLVEAIDVRVTPEPTATETPLPPSTATVTPAPQPTATRPAAETRGDIFVETFDGDPGAPSVWTDPDWDLTIHQRDQDRLYEMLPMAADHGPGCEPPPATHQITAFEDNLYICKNHMMTANYGASTNGGYGMIYFTPNRLLDTTGDFAIEFDLSTYRVNPNRNWVDVWITPFEKNLQLALNDYLPDLEGPPVESVQIQLTQENMMIVRIHENGQEIKLNFDGYAGFEDVLALSQRVRTTFYIGVENGQFKVGLPEHNLWWYDQTVPAIFRRPAWRETVVQFGHHSYTPDKMCEAAPNPAECSRMKADTFHWDNVTLSPVKPFTLVQAAPRLITDSTDSNMAVLSGPAPANAFLRFGGIGLNLEVSFDGGQSWQTAVNQQRNRSGGEEHFGSFWMPIPQGTTEVQFRGRNWFAGEWAVRDISVWSR